MRAVSANARCVSGIANGTIFNYRVRGDKTDITISPRHFYHFCTCERSTLIFTKFSTKYSLMKPISQFRVIYRYESVRIILHSKLCNSFDLLVLLHIGTFLPDAFGPLRRSLVLRNSLLFIQTNSLHSLSFPDLVRLFTSLLEKLFFWHLFCHCELVIHLY